MVMPLLAPWESLTLVQWVCSWGSSWGKNTGLSLFLPEPKAWAKVDIEGWPRGTACQGVGGELCFGSSKSGVEQPNLRLTGQIQGCTASQLCSRDDASGLSTLVELGVLVGAGECSSGSGSCGAGAQGARAGGVPCLEGFLSMQMPGSSCPAGVTHFLLLCHILVRPVWQRLSSLPPRLLLLLSPTPRAGMCICSVPGRMRQDFQETASKPQNLHIY